MDQSQQRTVTAPSSSRSYQFHPARAKIIDLFNLYLGVYIINLSLFLHLPEKISPFFDREEAGKSLMSLHEILLRRFQRILTYFIHIDLTNKNPSFFLLLNRNKSQKRVHAPSRDFPPGNEQFIVDFQQLQTQFNVKSFHLFYLLSC